MPSNSNQPANGAKQTTLDDSNKPDANVSSPDKPVDVEAIRAEIRKEEEAKARAQVEKANAQKEKELASQKAALDEKAAELAADREEVDAEAAALKEANEAAANQKAADDKLNEQDKRILELLSEGKNADTVAGATSVDRDHVIRVAFSNMNGESVYQLAERLGCKVNEVYLATDQKELVRYQISEEPQEDGSVKRKKELLDYEG